MGKARREMERLIADKRAEIEELRQRIADSEAYIRGVEEALALLPKEVSSGRFRPLRPGSYLDKARRHILSRGRPARIEELIEAVGMSQAKESRASLAGSIAGYVRRGDTFTRTAPNTFGLVEMERNTVGEVETEQTQA